MPLINHWPNSISIIDIKPFADISARYTLRRIAVESRSHQSAVTGDSRYALATHPILDSVIATITGTGKLYVSSAAKPTIWVIDQNTLELRSAIPIPGRGHHMVTVWF
jgi:hypothetical protein